MNDRNPLSIFVGNAKRGGSPFIDRLKKKKEKGDSLTQHLLIHHLSLSSSEPSISNY